jgi:hypothetical protein
LSSRLFLLLLSGLLVLVALLATLSRRLLLLLTRLPIVLAALVLLAALVWITHVCGRLPWGYRINAQANRRLTARVPFGAEYIWGSDV